MDRIVSVAIPVDLVAQFYEDTPIICANHGCEILGVS
jgi:hypothetical protein